MKVEKGSYWIKSGIINVLQNMSGVLFGVGGIIFLDDADPYYFPW